MTAGRGRALGAAAGGAIARALVDGALAGAAAGMLDVLLVHRRAQLAASDAPLAAVIVLGLGVVAGLVIGAPLVLAARGLGRHPLLAAVSARLRSPGPGRVGALVDVAAAVLACVATGVLVASAVRAIEGRYRAPGATAALVAVAAVVLGVAVLLLTTALAPALRRRLGGPGWVTRLTTGRAAALAVLAVVLGVIVVVNAALARVAPAWDAAPTQLVAASALLTILAAAVRPAARLGVRRAVVAGSLLAAVGLLALLMVGRAGGARGAIAAHGVTSGHVLRGLWHLTDGDGDGFGDGFGAADCDDADARVHPRALDLAGDGVDGNCSGGDPDPARLATARAARAARSPAGAGSPRHDLVLVTIDSVRFDRTTLAGYRHATTPNLAALARRAARFDRAHSPSPLTRRAVPALLYGRMAATLPFSSSRRWPLLADNALPTLATSLTAAGYRTAAIVSHRRLPLSDATYRGFAEVIGLSDELVSRHHDNADAVVDRALAWLAAPADRPRFLWLHLIDPHHPYRPPPSAPALGPGATAYDRELAFADAHLGRLLAALSADRTVIAVTSDHGEAFGEHHRRFHGRSLDDIETRVPLVIAAPGGAASATSTPVTLVDVAPTLLDLAGAETPAGMTGTSLAATVRTGAPPPPRAVLTELFDDGTGRDLIAVQLGDRKLVRDLAAWTVTAFDLAADPGERAPLTDDAAVRELTRALEAALDQEQATLPSLR